MRPLFPWWQRCPWEHMRGHERPLLNAVCQADIDDKNEDHMPRHHMPDSWKPPVPAWSANFGDSPLFAIAYCGVQSHTGDTTNAENVFALVRSGPDAPDHVERGRFTDDAGLVNQIFVCYWRDPRAHARFARESAFARWLADDDLLTSNVGVWVEAFHIPMSRFETLFSSESPAGAA